MNSSKVYTLNEVANILKITRQTVYDNIKKGNIAAVKIGKSWRVTHENLQTYISKGYSVSNIKKQKETPVGEGNKWISVEERLPNCNGNDDIEVLVFIKGALTATTLYFEGSSGEFFDERNVYDVTHWMPLPEPPKV